MKRYGCGSCGEAFNEREQLLDHADKVHQKKTIYMCITCDESFDKESAFSMHVARDHKLF